ncbi:MAG: GNAT family N-acetyltransferase, partial [Treponema sp.]|nr:GNAT family N-acetyltransferase [Treponema sp.]
MSLVLENNTSHWRRVTAGEINRAQVYLQAREKFCVAACSRFLNRGESASAGHVWQLPQADGEIAALLLHSRHSLFPVFDKKSNIPAPRFLSRFLGKIHIHAVQGLREDAELLENLMRAQGYCAAEHIDYDLMSFDNAGGSSFTQTVRGAVPAGLRLYAPRPDDEESLFALHAAYEQEEVLPAQSVFNPAAAR